MANNTIRVSIIIPVYKVEAYIIDCLSSVFRQTYNHLEIILVDDCTPDSSMQIALEELESERNHFEYKVIRHICNQGLSTARNSGVKIATGDYLYFLDSDDEITDDCIETLVELIKTYGKVDFAIAAIQVIGKNLGFRLTSPSFMATNMHVINSYLEGQWYEMACNKLIDRDYFLSNELWFKEGILHEDQLFSFQLATTATSMATSYKKTYLYKIRNVNSITSCNKAKNFDSYMQILRYMVDHVCLDVNPKKKNLEFAFAIRFAYTVLLSLQGKNALTNEEQVHYETLLFTLIKPLGYTIQGLPYIIIIKQIIMHLPSFIRNTILTWHYKKINL